MRHLFLLFALTAACAKAPGAYQASSDQAATTPTVDVQRMTREADILWAERAQPQKLLEALDGYQAVVDADPANRYARARLARGWYFHGDAHTTVEQVQLERWAKAVDHAKQCVALNPAFTDALVDDDHDAELGAISQLERQDVPCAYWLAASLGKWALQQDLTKHPEIVPVVQAYMRAIQGLDPSYFYRGPDRLFGVYYAIMPEPMQDLEQSAAHFDAALQQAPQYIATRVLRAGSLARASQDLRMFEVDLETVLAFDTTTVPELQPENTLEKLKAQALLDRREELFDRKALEAYDKDPLAQ